MTKSRTKKVTRFFAIFMATILLAMCVPTNVFGSNDAQPLSDFKPAIESTAGESLGATVNEGVSVIEGDVIGEYVEDVSRREENVKHFALPDGTYTAIVYPTAVHRKDADGVWQDINNDLALSSVKGTQKYETTDSRVSFARSFAPSAELMTLSENGYSISMSLISDSKNESVMRASTESFGLASVTNAAKKELPKTDVKLEDVAKVDNKSSIVYNNVRVNTDIEYILDGNDVKENIIVKAASSEYEYTFDLRLDGLVAILNENGSISVNDAETGAAKYIIPAPYMYDASGEMSYAVEYTLIEVSSGRYLLSVTADKTWINATGREFPVTIDPTLQPIILSSDTYVSAQSPEECYFASSDLCVCSDCTALIDVYLPTLPENATLISADLVFNYYFETWQPDMSEIGIYQIISSWSETETNYINAPSTDVYPLDTIYLYADERPALILGEASFDITYFAYNCYYGDVANNGVAIKFETGVYAVKIKSYDSGTYTCEYVRVDYAIAPENEFSEGIYAFRNIVYEDNWMTTNGNVLQHTYRSESPIPTSVHNWTEDVRSKLFKVSKHEATGRYIIRSMLDNRKVLTFSGNKYVFEDYPVDDSDVPSSHTFYIYEGEYGWLIKSVRTSDRFIGISGENSYNLTGLTEATAQNKTYWDCEKYIGSHVRDVYLDQKILPLGDPINISPKYWSTIIDHNILSITLRNEHQYGTDVDFEWNDDTMIGEVTFNIRGTFVFEWHITGEISGNSYGTVTVIVVPIIPDDADVEKTLDIKIYYDSSVLNSSSCNYTHEDIVVLFGSVNWYFWTEFGFAFNLVECELATDLDIPANCDKVNIYSIPICRCGGSLNCSINHHTKSTYLLNLLESTGNYYVLRLVGYGLCSIKDGNHVNNEVLGTAVNGGKDSVCSVSQSGDALEHVIIHELSHNLSADHCSGEDCVMNSTVCSGTSASEDKALGNWCNNCRSEIMSHVSYEPVT